MLMITNTNTGTKLANGGGIVTVNADGSVSVTPASGTGVLLGVAPPATATRALFQIGNGPVDGSIGHYVGSASGGGYGANFASGYTGDLINLQVAGTQILGLTAAGVLALGGSASIQPASNSLVVGNAGGGKATITDTSGANPSLIVRRVSSAAVDCQQWETSTAAVVGGVRSDGLLYATTAALATKVKAGIPADADWAVAPPDGTMVIDSTDSKAYWRVGGAWKSVVIA